METCVTNVTTQHVKNRNTEEPAACSIEEKLLTRLYDTIIMLVSSVCHVNVKKPKFVVIQS